MFETVFKYGLIIISIQDIVEIIGNIPNYLKKLETTSETEILF